MSLSTAAVKVCPADAGFLCNKAAILREGNKADACIMSERINKGNYCFCISTM
jgi:hypothetical protein